jgi:hypothetical protein
VNSFHLAHARPSPVRRQEPRAVTIHTPGFLFTTPALNPSERGDDDGSDRDNECGHERLRDDVGMRRHSNFFARNPHYYALLHFRRG